MKLITWKDVYSRISMLPKGKVYGIPRGGTIIAGLTGRAVDNWHDADYIVDDIVDSGHTQRTWEDKTGKQVIALVNKPQERIKDWVQFPWEANSCVKESVNNMLVHIGENPRRDGLLETPNRVIKSWDHLYGGYKIDPKSVLHTTFENDEKYDQMVCLKDIEFYSTCEHHMLPFFGTAKIAYIPNGRIVGISKLARILEVFSRRLQVQERLTNQIATAINKELKPIGVGVLLEAKHMCMVVRGVQKQNSVMTTSCLLGSMKDEASCREEFLRL